MNINFEFGCTNWQIKNKTTTLIWDELVEKTHSRLNWDEPIEKEKDTRLDWDELVVNGNKEIESRWTISIKKHHIKGYWISGSNLKCKNTELNWHESIGENIGTLIGWNWNEELKTIVDMDKWEELRQESKKHNGNSIFLQQEDQEIESNRFFKNPKNK